MRTRATKTSSKVVNMKETENNEVSEDRKKLFNSTMTNIGGFSTSKTRKKMIGIVAIDLSLLYTDMKYQCLRRHKHINKLIANWDERKLGAIVVVPHPEEYRFAIVDGQGRFLAASQLGYETLQAIVLLDAPSDPYERLKFEAEVFIGQDDEIEKVQALEKHPARVILGDRAAISLERMFIKYNITYTDSRGSRKPGILGSYPTTYLIASRNGEKCLDFVFSIISNAGWNLEPNGYSSYVIGALKDAWINYPSDRDKVYRYLSDTLRELNPQKFSSLAAAKYVMRSDPRKSCGLYLEDLIREKLGLIKTA